MFYLNQYSEGIIWLSPESLRMTRPTFIGGEASQAESSKSVVSQRSRSLRSLLKRSQKESVNHYRQTIEPTQQSAGESSVSHAVVSINELSMQNVSAANGGSKNGSAGGE